MDKPKLCVSISEKPGSFGFNFHNKGYTELGLNYFYFPLKILKKDLRGFIPILRDNFHGCSVSMPHKIEIVNLLDELDESVERTGSANTVLNKGGKLIGYNTDYYGAKKAINSQIDLKGKRVLMVGSGGVARAIAYAVKDLGGELTITNRTDEKAKSLANKIGAETIEFARRRTFSGDMIINATRVGFDNPDETIIEGEVLDTYVAAMDVVVPKNKFTSLCKKRGLITITGKIMTAFQAEKQFEIYTGKKYPRKLLNRYLK